MTKTLRSELVAVLKEFDPGGWFQDPRIDGWVERLAAAHDEEDATASEPCDSEIWSWSRFSPDAVDPYWIRCGLIGPHTEHEDSNTGAHWTDKDAA